MKLPAEWAPQSAVLFSFPNSTGDWGASLDAASQAMIDAANTINEVTRTVIIVGDPGHFKKYAASYSGQYVEIPTNDCWVRDFGPITVVDGSGQLTMLDFRFRGWGGKFAADLDDRVTVRLHAELFPKFGFETSQLELEGGSIESDGKGHLITTEKCLLNPNRNGGELTKRAISAQLKQKTGAQDILWLQHGELEGDDTDAHVDTLVRFLDERTIAYVGCDDSTDPHYAEFKLLEAELVAYVKKNPAFSLLPLPWCPPLFSREDGHRLPATYANFLISNGHIFVPTYYDGAPEDHPGKQTDHAALATFQAHGAYTVVGIPCRSFIEQHGSLHCLTMQIPKLT